MAAGLTTPKLGQLTDKEQRYATLGAWLGAAVSVALWAPSWDVMAGVVLSLIGLIMCGLLALAAKRRSRLWTGLACLLLSFGPWGMAWVIGLPYLVLAGWLVLKSPRLQPRLNPKVDENGEIVASSAATEETPAPVRARRWSRRRTTAGDGGTEVPEARRPPTASKRYTPPQNRS